eukprot:4031460-Pyramimonas_sp.AAC.1
MSWVPRTCHGRPTGMPGRSVPAQVLLQSEGDLRCIRDAAKRPPAQRSLPRSPKYAFFFSL